VTMILLTSATRREKGSPQPHQTPTTELTKHY